MSTIKLPPLPPIPEKQPNYDGGDDYWTESDFERYATAYAEEAVRQALATQVPVAWVIDARRGLSDPQFCWGNPDGVYKSLYVPLALIPENSDG